MQVNFHHAFSVLFFPQCYKLIGKILKFLGDNYSQVFHVLLVIAKKLLPWHISQYDPFRYMGEQLILCVDFAL